MNYGGGTYRARFIGRPFLFEDEEELSLIQGDTLTILHGDLGVADYSAAYRVQKYIKFRSWPEVLNFMKCAPQAWAGDTFPIIAALTNEVAK